MLFVMRDKRNNVVCYYYLFMVCFYDFKYYRLSLYIFVKEYLVNLIFFNRRLLLY